MKHTNLTELNFLPYKVNVDFDVLRAMELDWIR